MRTLTITDTNVLKGIALLLLLCHHCFYTGEPFDDILIFGHPLFQTIGGFSKLCVAIFVFLSGYGLTAKTMKDGGIGNLWNFYRYRYMKLMLNYWVVYLLFVPIGILLFHRTFPMVYGDNWIFKAIVDFLGIHFVVTGDLEYNATWWFFSCIILLYSIFPWLWRFRNLWMAMIPCSIMIPTFFYWSNSLYICATYLLPFFCGMVIAMHGRHEKIVGEGKFSLCLFFILGCIYWFYSYDVSKWQTGLIIIGIALYSSVDIYSKLKRLLSFWGKHSYNIFMFHTFIYFYYFNDYIYWSRNPVIILMTLLLVCTLISWIIELIKNKLNFKKFVDLVVK